MAAKKPPASAIIARNAEMIMNAKSLSRSDLIARGIEKKTLYNALRGDTNPTVETIETLARTLNVSITDLFRLNVDEHRLLFMSEQEKLAEELGGVTDAEIQILKDFLGEIRRVQTALLSDEGKDWVKEEIQKAKRKKIAKQVDNK